MRRGFFFLVLIVTLGLCATATPKISIDNTIYEFEDVVAGIAVIHMFTLTNSGDEPLLIERVHATCGCSTTILPKARLAAGESTKLEVIVDTVGLEGNINKSIYITSNDPNSPEQTLQIRGSVKLAGPYRIAAGDLRDWFYLLVDLRDPEDYAASHLIGAINIPYAELASWISRLPREALIVLYDEDESLSGQAVHILQQASFHGVGSLLGGLNEWMRQFKSRFLLGSSTDQ